MDAGLPRDAIRNILEGHDPKLSRVIEVASALGLEFYVGPPRAAGPEEIVRALNPGSTPEEARQAIAELSWPLSVAADLLQARERERQWSAAQKDRERDRKLIEAVKAGLRQHGDGEVLNPPLAAKIELSIDGPIFHEKHCDWKIFEYMVPSWASRADLIWIEASGDSMQPEIEPGDPILVDRSQTVPLENQLFLAAYPHGVAIRRVVRIGPVLAIRADRVTSQEQHPEWLDPRLDGLLGQVAHHGPEGGLHRRWWI